MSTKRKITAYRYIVFLLVVLFLIGVIYVVSAVLLQNRSRELQSQQVNLNITLPEVIRQIATEGTESLQWLSLPSDPTSHTAVQAGGVANHFPEPLPPTNIVTRDTKLGSSVILAWEPANGQTLTGVEIYRSTIEPQQPLQDMELVTTVELARGEYIDSAVSNATTYYYALRAYRVLPDETGEVADTVVKQYSAMSNVYSAIPTDQTAPNGPSWVRVSQYDSQQETGLLLTWETIVDRDVTGLIVYRSTEPGAIGTPLQTVLPAVTELVDKTVDPAVNYYYTITAIDASDNESSRTMQISRFGNGAPFVSDSAEASERIQNAN
jgi:hypothetical protein